MTRRPPRPSPPQLIQLEKEVDDLKTLVLQSTQAADQAKAAVQQNAAALQQKLAERQKLLSQLDQAKMQEQMNKAMATLTETVGEDVPTLDEVRDKIEARYAKAKGMAELSESIGRAPHARDRAGHGERRGAGPAVRAPRRARPRRRPSSSTGSPAGGARPRLESGSADAGQRLAGAQPGAPRGRRGG